MTNTNMKIKVIKDGKELDDVWSINFKDNSTTTNKYVVYTEDTELGRQVMTSNWPDEVQLKVENEK